MMRSPHCPGDAQRKSPPRPIPTLSRLRHAGAEIALCAATSCAQVPTTAAVAVPPVPAGEARVWFYRDEGPYETHAPATVRMNDAVVGELAPRGVFYRDTAPGHYHVAVDTYLADI